MRIVEKSQLMTAAEIDRTLSRLAHEIVERNGGTAGLSLIGVRRRGVPLSKRLARAILALLPALKQYDQQIAELFKAHDDAAIFSSLPGAGPALAPRLLVVFGSRRDRWRHSLDVATYSGIAPVIEQSGKRSIVHWRWACPKFVRQSLHEFARCSVRSCAWAKRFYQTQRARGNNHHGALRALAFKWIRILFRCWQDRSLYDPAKYAPAKL